jgi:hypothetical protein
MRRLTDTKGTKQVRIGADFHRDLRLEAARIGRTIRQALEIRSGWERTVNERKEQR